MLLALCAAPAFAETEAAAGQAADSAVHVPEYGESYSLEADEDGYAATIRYPVGNIDVLNDTLKKWASELMTEYETLSRKETADADGIRGQLHVDYDAYEVVNRYIGVKELGTYSGGNGKTKKELIYTCNYDMNAGELMDLNAVLASAHLDAVGALLVEKAREGGVSASAAALMEHFVLCGEGVQFIYADDKGVHQFLLNYNDIINYVRLFGEETASDARAKVSADNVTITGAAVCTHDGVHVRAEADNKSTLIATIYKNTALELVEQDENAAEGWTRIWFHNGYAYVASRYLQTDAGAASSAKPEITAAGVVTGNGVHVRAGDSTRSTKLGSLEKGERVQIIKAYYSDAWHKIWFEDQVAFISAKYVRLNGGAQSDNSDPQQIEAKAVKGPPYIEFIGTCTTNGVIVRSATSVHSNYYSKLYRGEGVEVIESECANGWDKVWIATNASGTRGYIGYVHSKYIQRPESHHSSGTNTNTVVPVVQVTPTPVPIGQGASPAGPAIGTGAGPADIPAIGSGVTVN